MRKIILSVLIFAYLFGSICNAKEIKPMDYKAIAAAETKMWQAYYQKNPEAVLDSLKLYFSESYGITNSKAIQEVAEKFAIAYEKFGMMPQNSTQAEYDAVVIPLLTSAYQSLKNVISASWNPH